jgi:flagellar biosynthesis protein FlhA
MSAGAPGGATSGGGSRAQAVMTVAVLAVLAIMILPLPAPAMDGLLALNIAVSVLVLLVAIGVGKPLDFSVFPSLLLMTTLFRLGLNVATTRLVLLNGGEGAAAAGHVIENFGQFAVGGSLIVGAVVFLILLVVNFSVITKGSGRIAEVAARFTLDALPGKQMAIDADLAAGLIDEREAKARRAAVEKEIEFFGAMDGASKFVRGDAVAGLIITAINIVGGLAAGLLRDHMSISSAVETYTILTIGDGLVSQLPALLVSTAAGIIVTRAGAGSELGSQMSQQIFGKPRTLQHAAGVLAAIAIVPGMPKLPFALLAGALYFLSRRLTAAAPAAEAKAAAAAGAANDKGPERLADLVALDALEVEVGHGLVAMIDFERGGELPGRVTSLRRQLAGDLGVVIPPIHLRDNLRLEAAEYRVRLRGIELGGGKAYPDRVMVLDPAGGTPDLPGADVIPDKEPAFGLAALWIAGAERARAEAAGFTVVEPAAVVTTHLSELLRRNAHELLGRQETQELLGLCAKEAPKLVEDTVPGALSLGELVRVLRQLLREGLSVRDMRTILEGVADAAARSKDPAFLIEQVRRRLFRQITARVADAKGVVHALTLDRSSEELLRRTLGQNEGEATLAPDVATARRLVGLVEAAASRLATAGLPSVMVTPSDLRRPLFEFAARFVPDLYVVTARELVPGTVVEPAGTIDLSTPPWSQAA